MPATGGPQLQLSVLVPTVRSDLRTRQALATVAMAGSADVEVLIGDNSADPDKWRFLHSLQATCTNVRIFCHTQNTGAHANYLFLLRQAAGALLCLTADDDIVAPDYYAAAASILATDPGSSAASGLLIGVTPGRDGERPHVFQAIPRIEETAIERIRQYGGVNLLAYAAARREPLLRLGEYLAANPLRAAFMDYLASYYLLAEGKFRIDASRPVYLYMNDRWSDEAIAWKTSASYYVACGLPEAFQHFHSLAWSIACLHLFLSRYRPPGLETTQAGQIAELLYDRWRADFLDKYARDPPMFHALLSHSAVARRALDDVVAGTCTTVARRFSAFLAVLAGFSQEHANLYGAFLASSLLDPAHHPDPAQPTAREPDAMHEIARLHARIHALESSHSWRITAPLRAVASWFYTLRR